MKAFDEAYWNLDQVVGWAKSRDSQAVEYARHEDRRSSGDIDRFAAYCSRRKLVFDRRNIDDELWSASGYKPESNSEMGEVAPLSVERLRLEREMLALPYREYAALTSSSGRLRHGTESFSDRAKRLLETMQALQEVQRRPQHKAVRKPFPIVSYLLDLFRSGRLQAIGNRPGDPVAYGLTAEDWSGLEIAVGDKNKRRSVWRLGSPKSPKEASFVPYRIGSGDFENVRVAKEATLECFPESSADRPDRSLQRVKPPPNEEVRKIILSMERALGRRPPIRAWNELTKEEKRQIRKVQFESIWREMYPNPKRGRPERQS